MTFVKKSFKNTLILSVLMIMVSPLIIEKNVIKEMAKEQKNHKQLVKASMKK